MSDFRILLGNMQELERYRGSMLGMAAADAVGTTIEFRKPGTFEPLTDMVGGGPFALNPGEWTDDTSMGLCLADSLIECKDFVPVDQLERYYRWWKDGYLASNGECFDMGSTTRQAMYKFERTWEPYCGSTDPKAAGNGSIMRLTAVPLFYANDLVTAIRRCADSSRTTHGAATCVDCCRYLGALIVGAVKGKTKEELLSPTYCESIWKENPLHPEVAEILAGSFRKEPPEIEGDGYCVKTLEAALWAFNKSTDFKDGCLLAVNLGDDADSVGAVYGQLAGAYYGEQSIPESWRDKLAMKEKIVEFAEKLYQLRK